MNITTDFARFLFEADQLAGQGQVPKALDALQKVLTLPGLWPEEQALAEARLAMLRAAQSEATAQTAQTAASDDDDALEIVERDSSEPPSEQARAEALVNDGDLEEAIAIYTQICAAAPDNSLASERLQELRARLQAAKQPEPTAQMPADAASLDAPPVQTEPVQEDPAFSEGFDVQFTDLNAVVQPAAETQQEQPEQPAATESDGLVQQAAAQVQAQLDAGLADWRKDLPRDPVAMLQTLLDRVQRNRRPRP